jgi:hypothetical protein
MDEVMAGGAGLRPGEGFDGHANRKIVALQLPSAYLRGAKAVEQDVSSPSQSWWLFGFYSVYSDE